MANAHRQTKKCQPATRMREIVTSNKLHLFPPTKNLPCPLSLHENVMDKQIPVLPHANLSSVSKRTTREVLCLSLRERRPQKTYLVCGLSLSMETHRFSWINNSHVSSRESSVRVTTTRIFSVTPHKFSAVSHTKQTPHSPYSPP